VGAIMTRFLLPALLLVAACGSKPKPEPEVPTPPTPTVPTALADAGPSADDAGALASADAAPTEALPPPGSKKISKKQDPTWASCHSSFKAKTKDLAAEVQKMAKGCDSVTKMKAVGPPQKGKQDAKNVPQQVKLKAQAGKCYRVYAESEPTIKDLDLVVKDSAGDVGAEDSTDDTNPVLVEDGAFCFKDADDATIVISVGDGKGSYAFQIYSD
jgi:hypothetical protein